MGRFWIYVCILHQWGLTTALETHNNQFGSSYIKVMCLEMKQDQQDFSNSIFVKINRLVSNDFLPPFFAFF